MAGSEEDKCPVDHKSREAWLSKAREASAAAGGSESSTPSLPPSHPPVSASSAGAEDSCPVDHNARQVWLDQAKQARPQAQVATAASAPQAPASSWSSYIPRIPFFSSAPSASQSPQATLQKAPGGLGMDREVSTIPRSSRPGETEHIANQEQETGSDSATGNWIYPSEKMFFDAMKRKGHDPQAPDMRTVVPIHNAVNERAWKEIKEWEGPWIKGTSCDGPRLHSFNGLSTKMSPKARFNTLLGYQAPFDRHDWVVDRCGTEIEYIIDFYAGRPNGAGEGKLSFYLDVRPKLNSWEGVKMRAFRAAGLA